MQPVNSRKDLCGKSSVYSSTRKPEQISHNTDLVCTKNNKLIKHIKKYYSKKRRSNFKQLDNL